MKFLLQRGVRAVLMLAGVSILCFLFSAMAPGSFFDELRVNPQISPETISSLQGRYGLDQPLALRYIRWVKAATHGDFGYSLAYNAPVAPLLWTRAKNTLLLTSVSMALTWMISIPLGVWTAARRDRAFDQAFGFVTSLLISIPQVAMAVAVLALIVHFRMLPVGGMQAVDNDGLSRWQQVQAVASRMLVPALLLTILETAVIARHVRASVIEVLGTPFAHATRGFGIPPARYLFRHLLPAAAAPAISLFGLSVAGLASGSLLVEVICGWPGLGPLILDATLSRDLCVVIGGIMFAAVFLVGGNLLADALLVVFDPRIRTGAADAF